MKRAMTISDFAEKYAMPVASQPYSFRIGMSGCIDIRFRRTGHTLHISCAGKLNEGTGECSREELAYIANRILRVPQDNWEYRKQCEDIENEERAKAQKSYEEYEDTIRELKTKYEEIDKIVSKLEKGFELVDGINLQLPFATMRKEFAIEVDLDRKRAYKRYGNNVVVCGGFHCKTIEEMTEVLKDELQCPQDVLEPLLLRAQNWANELKEKRILWNQIHSEYSKKDSELHKAIYWGKSTERIRALRNKDRLLHALVYLL